MVILHVKMIQRPLTKVIYNIENSLICFILFLAKNISIERQKAVGNRVVLYYEFGKTFFFWPGGDFVCPVGVGRHFLGRMPRVACGSRPGAAATCSNLKKLYSLNVFLLTNTFWLSLGSKPKKVFYNTTCGCCAQTAVLKKQNMLSYPAMVAERLEQ